MIFRETELSGAYLIDLEKHEDSRGFFARVWCRREFAEHGLNPRLVQANLSYNRKAGTLRGLHYQEAPFAEAKLVRCARGAVYDVIVDLRPESPTFLKSLAFELNDRNGTMCYVPENFAHGFQTLVEDTEVFYQMSEFYSPEHSRGVRWNDPALRIEWPIEAKIVSERDRSHPDFDPERLRRQV